MTDDDVTGWPPALLESFQQASERTVEQQKRLFEQLMSAGSTGFDMSNLNAMSQTATFKTRVQSGGRVSIPDAEREALDIEEGDIVQTVVVPVKRNREQS
jgi:hypothetical protein